VPLFCPRPDNGRKLLLFTTDRSISQNTVSFVFARRRFTIVLELIDSHGRLEKTKRKQKQLNAKCSLTSLQNGRRRRIDFSPEKRLFFMFTISRSIEIFSDTRRENRQVQKITKTIIVLIGLKTDSLSALKTHLN